MAQRVVIDANATLGLFLRLPFSVQVDRQMQAWGAEEARLIVPTLWEYECLTGLRRAVTLKLISPKEAERMVEDLLALEFQRVPPTLELHRAALQWAERIGQSKVYDAHYLALAENLSAAFWTADHRLFRALQGIGVDWVFSFLS
ncbi:MAG TPA: type II toxin-antitoxin system VapC family toxin [Anaerolineales bacterium]|nr:type II toxin-antitoxin system VapC family toxin [Anaerolineales bacterium]